MISITTAIMVGMVAVLVAWLVGLICGVRSADGIIVNSLESHGVARVWGGRRITGRVE